MNDTEAEREAERAIARWAVGEVDLEGAIHHACWALGQGRPGACAVVRSESSTLLGLHLADAGARGGEGACDPRAFVRVAALARSAETLDIAEGHPQWPSLFPEDDGVSWAACAPAFGPDGETRGFLVAVGDDAGSRRQALAALPHVARICGAMLASDDAGRTAVEVAHRMNNLLATALANVAFACTVVEGEGQPDSDLARALRNTRDSASQCASSANRLVRLATRGR